MEQKKSKNLLASPDVNEVWIAGGPVWINFANTVALAEKGLTDVLGSLDSLSWWLGTVGLRTPQRLGSADLAFAAGVRESLTRVITCIEASRPIEARDLRLFNSILREQHEWVELDQLADGTIVTMAVRSEETIEQALGPVVESLTETLVQGDLTRLRECAHPDCVLRFYDDSKNGARRWCTMSGCGNRAKAAAFLQRKKVQA